LRQLLATISLGSYLTVLVAASLWPQHIDGQGLLASITNQILGFTSTVSWLRWFNYDKLEALANVVLYVPLGLFLAVSSHKAKPWLLCFVPVLVSFLTESSQMLFLPERYATVTDVLFNSLGGVMGIFTVVSIRQLMRSSRTEH